MHSEGREMNEQRGMKVQVFRSSGLSRLATARAQGRVPTDEAGQTGTRLGRALQHGSGNWCILKELAGEFFSPLLSLSSH